MFLRIRTGVKLIVLFTLINLIPGSSGFARTPTCDKHLKPVGGKVAYTLRGNRCEGFYQSPVSGSLALVGLFAGPFKYNLETDQFLYVTSPLQKGVNIRSVGIPLKTYYRLDAAVRAGGILKWPLRDVIRPRKLFWDEIGVFGWFGSESRKIFVPVRVRTSSPGKSTGTETLRVVLRASVDIDLVKWRSGPRVSGRCTYSGWKKLKRRRFRGGEPIQILLSRGSIPRLCLDVYAKPANGESLRKQIYMRSR